MSNFESLVDEFIGKLKNFNTETVDYIFNPWMQSDDTDSHGATEIRCENLRKYLIDHKNAKYILVAESPSIGARYTGIAMTSEKIIEKYNLSYKKTSKSWKEKNLPTEESTAEIVWEKIYKNHKDYVFWNAFALNFNCGDGKWYKTPKDSEIYNELNIDILKTFLEMFKNKPIIALGRTAQKAIGASLSYYTRHPSTGGKTAFIKGVDEIISKISSKFSILLP